MLPLRGFAVGVGDAAVVVAVVAAARRAGRAPSRSRRRRRSASRSSTRRSRWRRCSSSPGCGRARRREPGTRCSRQHSTPPRRGTSASPTSTSTTAPAGPSTAPSARRAACCPADTDSALHRSRARRPSTTRSAGRAGRRAVDPHAVPRAAGHRRGGRHRPGQRHDRARVRRCRPARRYTVRSRVATDDVRRWTPRRDARHLDAGERRPGAADAADDAGQADHHFAPRPVRRASRRCRSSGVAGDLRKNYALSRPAQGSALGTRSPTASSCDARRRRVAPIRGRAGARGRDRRATPPGAATPRPGRRAHPTGPRRAPADSTSPAPSPPHRPAPSANSPAAPASPTSSRPCSASSARHARNSSPRSIALVARELGVPARVVTGFRVLDHGASDAAAPGTYPVDGSRRVDVGRDPGRRQGLGGRSTPTPAEFSDQTPRSRHRRVADSDADDDPEPGAHHPDQQRRPRGGAEGASAGTRRRARRSTACWSRCCSRLVRARRSCCSRAALPQASAARPAAARARSAHAAARCVAGEPRHAQRVRPARADHDDERRDRRARPANSSVGAARADRRCSAAPRTRRPSAPHVVDAAPGRRGVGDAAHAAAYGAQAAARARGSRQRCATTTAAACGRGRAVRRGRPRPLTAPRRPRPGRPAPRPPRALPRAARRPLSAQRLARDRARTR